MGWASGSEIAEVIEKLLLKYVPKNKLKMEANKVFTSLTDMDWDCVEEVELFHYLQIMECMDEKEDYDFEEVDEFELKIKKYKKKFGF